MIGDQMSKVYIDAEKILEMIKQESASEDAVISDNTCKFCKQELIIKFSTWLIEQLHGEDFMCLGFTASKEEIYWFDQDDFENTITKLTQIYLGGEN